MAELAFLLPRSLMQWHGLGRDTLPPASHHPSLTMAGRRPVPAPHQWQHSGEQVLHLAQAAQ